MMGEAGRGFLIATTLSTDSMFYLALPLLLLPAIGALINTFAGKQLGRRNVGYVASGAVIGSFVLAVAIFFLLLFRDAETRVVEVFLWNWISIGDFEVPAALLIDPLSATMMLVVTGVGSLIHVYSISYMDHEPRYQRFFVYLNFFVFAMLILVLSNNFVGMFVGWEGVGLASFLLIGFYFEKYDDTYGWYADCGKKAFLVNRVGDFGMMVAMFAIWSTLGSLTFLEVFELAEINMSAGLATFVCLMLLLGAAGKSAQIPLYVWLPDAMAGPTPVSALIHAATMVTAGVYMIARTHTLWHLSEAAMLTAAWIGALTALLGASIALVQFDLKKILAYSTVSQLGFMILGVGVGAYGAAIFHLVTHAFFKALLFLAAGSVMHSLDGELDIRKMGGLRRKMPTTANTFLVGAAALAGVPLMSGFFSKDAILLGAIEYPFLYAIGLLTALLTAFYSFRAAIVPFYGEPRDPEVYDHAHESPPLMTRPLQVLAVLSIIAGLINLPFILSLDHFLEPSIGYHEPHGLAQELLAILLSSFIALLGVTMAVARYTGASENWMQRVARGFSSLNPLLEHKWYVDDFYRTAIVNPLLTLSRWFAIVFDRRLIDGLVNGVGRLSMLTGEGARRIQNGAIPTYALSILVGVVAVVIYFVVV